MNWEQAERSQLAERLLRSGAATKIDLVRAQQVKGGMVALAFTRERKLAEALSRAERHPAVVLSETTFDLSAFDLLPQDIAETYGLLPVALTSEEFTLAASQLELGSIVDQIAYAAARPVTIILGIKELIQVQLPLLYAARQRGEELMPGERSRHSSPHAEILRFASESEEAGVAQLMQGLRGSMSLLRGAASLEKDRNGMLLPAKMPVPVLPADSAHSAEAAARPQLPSTSDAPRALVVEDDESIRTLVTRVLEKDGWLVTTAATGTDAIALLQNGKPSLIVLDAMLPGLHGFEVCTKLKASAYKDVPVIMMSAVYRGWEQAREIQERHGADAFLEKPFNVQMLRKTAANFRGVEQESLAVTEKRREASMAHQQRADDLCEQLEWDEAIAELHKALEANPFDAACALRLGNVLSQKSEFGDAMRAYEIAAICDPKSFSAAVNLASTYDRLGFKRKGAESWRRARTLAHDDTAREMIDARLTEG